jgi:uncharacterized protein (TIGR02594 family)
MTQFNAAILEAAGAYLGVEEWPGAKHNPEIIAMFERVGHRIESDETPWCAGFVGSVLASLGLPHTGKLNARSYQTYGQSVRMQDARPGDIVVLWRGSPTSWQGHVAFFVEFKGDKVILRGGNQGNKVSDAAYPIDRIVAIRRADGVEAQGKRPVLRQGDRGAFVHDLQAQLAQLGYTLGKQDGQFGARTLAAVVAFQADNGLTADGIVGDCTWAALVNAAPREMRQISKADLKDSRTIKAADEGKVITAGAATIGGAVVAVETAEQVADVAQRAGSLVQGLLSVGPWPLLALIVIGAVAFLVWRRFQRIEDARIEDARTGANDAR